MINVRKVLCLMALLMVPMSVSAQCPQYRETAQAPDDIYWQQNPLAADRGSFKAGKKLWKRNDCVKCHGKRGDGLGPLAKSFAPPPRNLACAEMMADIPDGQLFWIIRNGSQDTAMPAYPDFSDEQIWQLVTAIRKFAE